NAGDAAVGSPRGRDRSFAARERTAAHGARHFKKVDRDLCWNADMRFRFIEDRRADYPVTILCDVLGVSPAGYYAWRARPDSRHGLPIAPNLLGRNFFAAAPNRIWLADITYIETDQGWLYLAAVMDLYSRRIVGWAMADHLRADLPLAALKMAISGQRPGAGLIHHSDRGVQYASADYRKVMQSAGFRASMSRKADCYDNAPMESFFHTLKTELVHHRHYATRAEAKRDIFAYIEGFY